jgi:hypothetical protein
VFVRFFLTLRLPSPPKKYTNSDTYAHSTPKHPLHTNPKHTNQSPPQPQHAKPKPHNSITEDLWPVLSTTWRSIISLGPEGSKRRSAQMTILSVGAMGLGTVLLFLALLPAGMCMCVCWFVYVRVRWF